MSESRQELIDDLVDRALEAGRTTRSAIQVYVLWRLPIEMLGCGWPPVNVTVADALCRRAVNNESMRRAR